MDSSQSCDLWLQSEGSGSEGWRGGGVKGWRGGGVGGVKAESRATVRAINEKMVSRSSRHGVKHISAFCFPADGGRRGRGGGGLQSILLVVSLVDISQRSRAQSV